MTGNVSIVIGRGVDNTRLDSSKLYMVTLSMMITKQAPGECLF